MKALLIPTTYVTLFRCASPLPKYVAQESAAIASLKSDIDGAYSHNDSIDIYVSEGTCSKGKNASLFSVRKSKSVPEGFVKVAANRPLGLRYSEIASGGRTCNVTVEVNLKEGKSYSLVGGFDYKSGPIPTFSDTRMCRFGVQNTETRMPVPIKRCS